MRYESEVLYDLMKRDGLLNPSQDNLPYESELKEKYINDVEGAYPKLIDYQAEWLNYSLEKPIGVFPYVTLTDVTNATIDNVVPYAYQSAILKGNSIKNYKNNLFDNVLEKGTISISNGEPNGANLRCYRSVNFIPINGKFKIAKYGIYGDLHVCFYDSNKSFISGQANVLRKALEGNATVTPPTNSSFIKFYNPYDDNEPTGEFGYGVMAENEIIELEIQSVKMPVLTTSNEDGTKSFILSVNEDVTMRGIGVGSNRVEDELDCLTGKVTECIREVTLNGGEDWSINNSNNDGFYSCSTSTYVGVPDGKIICDKLPSVTSTKTEGVMMGVTTGKLIVSFNRDKSGVTSLSSFKEKLSQLQLKVCYEIENVDKTVDLMITNQNGESLSKISPIEGTMHLSTSSDTIPPLFSGEIPIEAIEQNLASFADLEGVEHDG